MFRRRLFSGKVEGELRERRRRAECPWAWSAVRRPARPPKRRAGRCPPHSGRAADKGRRPCTARRAARICGEHVACPPDPRGLGTVMLIRARMFRQVTGADRLGHTPGAAPVAAPAGVPGVGVMLGGWSCPSLSRSPKPCRVCRTGARGCWWYEPKFDGHRIVLHRHVARHGRLPSRRAPVGAVRPDGVRRRGGRAGHFDAGRVHKHTKPLEDTDFLAEEPSSKGFTCLSAHWPMHPPV